MPLRDHFRSPLETSDIGKPCMRRGRSLRVRRSDHQHGDGRHENHGLCEPGIYEPRIGLCYSPLSSLGRSFSADRHCSKIQSPMICSAWGATVSSILPYSAGEPV